jgi:hypothetical protein
MALEDRALIRKAFKTEKEIHIVLGFLLGCLIAALITYIEAEWSLADVLAEARIEEALTRTFGIKE